MIFKLIFAWYDFWIGFYWNREDNKLYIFPIPMFGLMIQFHLKKNNEKMKEQLWQSKR
jgi:hypothetical protein